MPYPALADLDQTLQLQQQIFRLQALLEATRQVHATIHLDDVLHQVLEIAVKELEATGACFRGGAVPDSVYGDQPDTPPISSLELKDKQGQRLTELLVWRREPLSLEEQDFLDGLALQAAISIENARYHAQALEWERVQQDLAAARAIQRSLLPQTMPHLPGYSIAARSKACYEVGGDYLDILSRPDGRSVIVVADVAGKGLASAMVSSSFRSAFRAMASASLPLDEIAVRMNDLHYGEGQEARRRYVTAMFLQLDTRNGELEVVNAGHNPGFLVRGANDYQLLEASGPPLGMLPKMSYTLEHHTVGTGGRLLLYTDGLTEVFQGEEEFGMERLLDAFHGCCGDDCDVHLDSLWRTLEEFSTEAQRDDMTALALLRHEGVA